MKYFIFDGTEEGLPNKVPPEKKVFDDKKVISARKYSSLGIF